MMDGGGAIPVPIHRETQENEIKSFVYPKFGKSHVLCNNNTIILHEIIQY